MLRPMNLDLLCFLCFYLFIYLFIFLILTVFNYVCVSAFEQGHLDPWRSENAFIIITIINLIDCAHIKRCLICIDCLRVSAHYRIELTLNALKWSVENH